jgi:hypothetical protein
MLLTLHRQLASKFDKMQMGIEQILWAHCQIKSVTIPTSFVKEELNAPFLKSKQRPHENLFTGRAADIFENYF